MENKYFLKPARDVYNNLVSQGYFKRYNLSDLNNQFIHFSNKFKNRNNREPFVFDVLDFCLKTLNNDLKYKIKKVLNNKDFDWFINVGQYFFYNLYDWSKNLKIMKTNDSKDYETKNFLTLWWNKFLEYEYGGIKEHLSNNKLSKYPDKILLELTNNCNLNCIMCGIGKNDYDPSRNLSLELFEKLCKTVLSEVSMIRLNGLGESTILPNFLDYLYLIKKISVKIEIVTNLIIQKKEIWDSLLEKETNFLISCDSSNPKRFEYIRRGSKFEIFEKNLEYIGNNVSDPLQAQIIFTLMEENIEDLIGVIELASRFNLGGVIVNVIKSNSNDNPWMRKNYDKIIKIFQKSYQIAKEYNINIRLPDHFGNRPTDLKISNPSCSTFCENPWKELYIRYNGDLTVCNMLNPYIYGNCKNFPFDKIWTGLNSYLFRYFVNSEYYHYYCHECYCLT